MIADEPLDHGKKGYYLVSSGSVAWDDIYKAMGKTLKKHGVISDTVVAIADPGIIEKIAAFNNVPRDVMTTFFGGRYV